jgi:hypothetical protein
MLGTPDAASKNDAFCWRERTRALRGLDRLAQTQPPKTTLFGGGNETRALRGLDRLA